MPFLNLNICAPLPQHGLKARHIRRMDAALCRSALRGVVLDASEAPVRDALVLLMKAGEGDGDDSVLACCFTQPDGGFAFGPLPGNALYIVRVFKSSARLRNVEITLE